MPLEDASLLAEFLGKEVVVDLQSPYVCLGKLLRVDERFVELGNADLHDLRDTSTSRENYVASAVATGVKRNRRRVLVAQRDIVAISRLEDIVES